MSCSARGGVHLPRAVTAAPRRAVGRRLSLGGRRDAGRTRCRREEQIVLVAGASRR